MDSSVSFAHLTCDRKALYKAPSSNHGLASRGVALVIDGVGTSREVAIDISVGCRWGFHIPATDRAD